MGRTEHSGAFYAQLYQPICNAALPDVTQSGLSSTFDIIVKNLISKTPEFCKRKTPFLNVNHSTCQSCRCQVEDPFIQSKVPKRLHSRLIISYNCNQNECTPL